MNLSSTVLVLLLIQFGNTLAVLKGSNKIIEGAEEIETEKSGSGLIGKLDSTLKQSLPWRALKSLSKHHRNRHSKFFNQIHHKNVKQTDDRNTEQEKRFNVHSDDLKDESDYLEFLRDKISKGVKKKVSGTKSSKEFWDFQGNVSVGDTRREQPIVITTEDEPLENYPMEAKSTKPKHEKMSMYKHYKENQLKDKGGGAKFKQKQKLPSIDEYIDMDYEETTVGDEAAVSQYPDKKKHRPLGYKSVPKPPKKEAKEDKEFLKNVKKYKLYQVNKTGFDPPLRSAEDDFPLFAPTTDLPLNLNLKQQKSNKRRGGNKKKSHLSALKGLVCLKPCNSRLNIQQKALALEDSTVDSEENPENPSQEGDYDDSLDSNRLKNISRKLQAVESNSDSQETPTETSLQNTNEDLESQNMNVSQNEEDASKSNNFPKPVGYTSKYLFSAAMKTFELTTEPANVENRSEPVDAETMSDSQNIFSCSQNRNERVRGYAGTSGKVYNSKTFYKNQQNEVVTTTQEQNEYGAQYPSY